MRSLAQATPAVGAAVLGIMIISLGNLAVFMHESYPHGMPPQVTAAVSLVAAGLVGIMASVVLSVRAVSVTRVRQPISREGFGSDARGTIEGMLDASDDEVYGELVESCVDALEDRERAIDSVGFRTSWAQVSLLGGLLVAGVGIMMALVLVASSTGSG